MDIAHAIPSGIASVQSSLEDGDPTIAAQQVAQVIQSCARLQVGLAARILIPDPSTEEETP